MSGLDGRVFSLTVKKSKKRVMWQMKRANHDVVSLHWMSDIFEGCLPVLGFDPADRDVVYRLSFSDQQFAGCQISLAKGDPSRSRYYGKAKSLHGTYYEVHGCEGDGGSLQVGGFVPEVITGYFQSAPESLYFRIELTSAAIFVE